MGKTHDLTGQPFGRLVAVCKMGSAGDKSLNWLCRCECGNLIIASSNNLKRTNTQSCGCLQKDRVIETSTTHGDTSGGGTASRLYYGWINMKQRCFNPNIRAYKYYGNKGITVCKEWLNSYQAFKWWAILNGYQENLTIDRIDSGGNYEPSNCQWITISENVKKSKNIKKEIQ